MLISELSFGSFLAYSPRIISNKSYEIKKSKNLMLSLKKESSFNIGSDIKFMSEIIADRIKAKLNDLPFRDFFVKNIVLVPVPKSSLMKPGTLWVPEKIVNALSNLGLGISCPCLQRYKALPKSSYSLPNERPRPIEHFNSLKILPTIHHPENILLVDDIITRGSTFLGCASFLKKHFPNTIIRAFAVMRTISNANDFKSITDPIVGKISLSNGHAFRNP